MYVPFLSNRAAIIRQRPNSYNTLEEISRLFEIKSSTPSTNGIQGPENKSLRESAKKRVAVASARENWAFLRRNRVRRSLKQAKTA